MRSVRLKILGRPACYHIICRITQGQLWLGDDEKLQLISLMHRVGKYCGVEVLTFCVMTNHFHLLVRVPEKTEADASVEGARMIERVRGLYGEEVAERLGVLWHGRSDPTTRRLWEAERQCHLNRMHDLSVFMKLLKQRFTMWHNSMHGTRGTLWTERFKSLVVEDRPGADAKDALRVVAAYIELNPVRAGLVKAPQDYAYSGLGSGVLGNVESQQGLMALGAGKQWSAVRKWYEELLLGKLADFSSRHAALVKGIVLGSAAFVIDVLQVLAGFRRMVRPQSYAAGGLGGDLYVGRRFRDP